MCSATTAQLIQTVRCAASVLSYVIAGTVPLRESLPRELIEQIFNPEIVAPEIVLGRVSSPYFMLKLNSKHSSRRRVSREGGASCAESVVPWKG